MSRRYTPEQRAAALARLDDNFGDIALTSAQTGIGERTIWRWKKARRVTQSQRGLPPPPPQHTPSSSPLRLRPTEVPVGRGGVGGGVGGVNDEREGADLALLDTLRQRLVEKAIRLLDSLDDIEDAPLNQRATALHQVLGMIVKLTGVLPRDQIQEEIFRIEFKDPDGSIHTTPYWARDDSEE